MVIVYCNVNFKNGCHPINNYKENYFCGIRLPVIGWPWSVYIVKYKRLKNHLLEMYWAWTINHTPICMMPAWLECSSLHLELWLIDAHLGKQCMHASVWLHQGFSRPTRMRLITFFFHFLVLQDSDDLPSGLSRIALSIINEK